MTVAKTILATILASSTLAACSAGEKEKKERTESLRDYVASSEGQRKLAQTRTQANSKAAMGAGPTLAMIWSRIEGRWEATGRDGTRIVFSFDRNGTATAEVLDGANRTIESAQGTVIPAQRAAGGTFKTTAARSRLAPFAKWIMVPDGGEGQAKINGAGGALEVRKLPRRT